MPAFSQAFHMENVMLDRTPSRELQEHLLGFSNGLSNQIDW